MITKELFFQIVKFGIVGVIAAITDVGVLVLLTEVFSMGVLVSSAVSFCVSVVVNYLLSMKFVFESRGGNPAGEFLVFVVLSAGGLGINQLIMWLGTDVFDIYYLAVKISAMVIVPVYNFITRKIFLEKKKGEGQDE